MRKRRNSPMWEFLDRSGILEKGSEDEINAAKRAYRKKYLSDFKKNQRQRKPEFSVRFSKDNGESKRIIEAARKHYLSVPAFLKATCFAYLSRTYIVPNRLMVAHLQQLLSDCLNEIKTISNTKERFWEREQKLDRIERSIQKLEAQMNEVFRNPTLFSNDHKNQIPQT